MSVITAATGIEALDLSTGPRCLEGIEHLRQLMAGENAGRVLLVVDADLAPQEGVYGRVRRMLGSAEVAIFSDFTPNPTSEQVARGARVYGELRPRWLIALGGGSTIDTAKGMLSARMEIERGGIGFIAIPTTAGTGSEATSFAAIYYDGIKRSLAGPDLLPDVAILDASLTDTLPPRMTAATGLDALCQAIESMWAVGATDRSLVFAERSLRLGWSHLRRAVHDPRPEDRRAMLMAAHLAGRAINLSKTTACHALSYAITTGYGLAHGSAVALTIGPMLLSNAAVGEDDCADPRGPEHVRGRIARIIDCLGAVDARDAASSLTGLIESIGCPTMLSSAGVQGDRAIGELAGAVNLERLGNNPRRLEDREIRRLLGSIA